ncbi:SusC/RagA family TonB-linked outer membrane protein [Flavobacterium sp. GT2N3]|uniref:SusC/RagA family TonB-linked outer membrane protein n=1 Tax=unclassified Flavobacterium TaxID=196869 RepID=UPI003AAD0B30
MKNKIILLYVIALFTLMHTAGYAQEKTVRGVVTDPSGLPIPGANVVIKGSQMGTSTGFDGTYSINASSGDILIYTYTGSKTEEKTIGQSNVYNIMLKEESGLLDEVVVVGYGTQKKKNVTTSIASMKTDLLGQRPVAQIDQAMVGQMAGVRVVQTSGVPGKGLSVQIRGSGSISANNQPLYVVDGFPLETSSQNNSGSFGSGNPLDNISPNDIQSIQVLKDAAAAAIYGSRASNGVVVITTKSGSSGAPIINFNTYFGVTKTVKKLDILSSQEWIDRATEMIDYNWVHSATGRTADQTSAVRRAILGSFNANLIKDDRWAMPGHPGLDFIDWQDQLFRTGVVKNYQLSARGGTEAVKYYVSADHLDQEGVAIGIGYKRYSARANISVNLSDKLSFGVNISPSYSISSDPGVEGKDQQLHSSVTSAPISENGLDYNTNQNTAYAWGTSRPSPVRYVENTIGDTKIFRNLTNLFANYKIIPGLTIKTTLNLDNVDNSYKFFSPSFVSATRLASAQYTSYRKQNFVNENTISYDKTINEKHTFNILGGASYSSFKFDYQRITGAQGFGTDYISTLNAANNINASSTLTTETKRVLLSYFGRVQYNFDDRFLATATIRRDGSSNFGTNTKWGIFPSASMGWNIANEKFMTKVSSISDLKLRGSWGLTGNNGLGDYASISRVGFSNYSLGGNRATGQVPLNSTNPDLSWETAETYNFGVDLGLFNNRIFASLDYYIKTNSDLLLNVPVPSASGFGSATTNIGEVENRGWELELSTKNITGSFQWTTNFNLSHNSNVIKKLGPNNSPIFGGGAFDIPHNILMVGQPMYSLFLVQQEGILTQEDIANNVALLGSNQTVGDPKYVDANGDGVISQNDRVLSGHPNPDYLWGVTNTLKYKGFDLSILLQGQTGGLIYSTFGRAIDRTGMGFNENVLGSHRERWISAEDPGAGSKGKANSSFGRIKNTDWLYSSDYWRIRNITFGYDLGAQLGNKVFKGLRLYVTLENWIGGDKYTGGFNPEAVNNDGDDYGGFPLSKSIITGLNFTF